MIRIGAVLCIVVIATISLAEPPTRPATWSADPGLERRVEQLLAQMTLEERLGQLNQFSNRGAEQTGPGKDRDHYDDLIANGRIGSILNATGPTRTNELQRIAVEKSRLKVPILFGLDVIHGYWTTFPIPLALASTWNPDLAQRTAAVAAREASADGIRWTFSPMVDIARDARWGRIAEGAGEDPFLGAAFARAYVRGYQGDNLSNPGSIAACAKHYVGYGAAEGGRDYNSTEISDRTLREIYLPPFKAAADEGVMTFMSAFNAINGVPASSNRFTLDQILRREWGFRGFVVSDWASVSETILHGTAIDAAAAARNGILAGVDMDMEGELYLNHLAAEISAGRVPLAVVDEAVRRVLRVKFALGLFERPYTPERTAPPPLNPADLDLARTAAEESFVLLKNDAINDSAVLPLGNNVRRIALIGALADAPAEMLGTWAARGDAKNVVTLRSALADYAAKRQIELTYAKGCAIDDQNDSEIAAAVEAARNADVILLAAGESRGMSGEAASRTRLDLPGAQPQLLDALAATGKPIVMIIFSGRPLALSPYVDKPTAIVQAWHPGLQAGPALVRILSGDANFTGRLTVSMPRSVGQMPLYYNHLNTGRPAADELNPRKPTTRPEKFLSKYIDEQNTPLYPFGFGLSYTTFEYSAPTLDATMLSAKALNDGAQKLKVTAEIRNTGDRDGVEVVQLYIRQRGTSVARPVRELKGFQRIALRAGESKRLEFVLGREELAFWNIDMKHIVEPAKLTMWVGKDSQSGGLVEWTIGE